jgi:tetratricopeptide (TPR) repeat protein
VDEDMDYYRFGGIPLEAQYRLRQGQELAARGDECGALACFKQAALIAPRFSKAFKEAGDCLCRLGRHSEAVIYYRKAQMPGISPCMIPIAVTAAE